MARGNPNPKTVFDKDRKKASEAGKKSKKANKGLMDARKLTSQRFESIVYKYAESDLTQLKQAMQNPTTPAIELVVIKLLVKGIEQGDYQRINFLLDRTIGKVKESLNLNVTGSTHKSIVDQIKESRDVTPKALPLGDDEC